MSTNSFLYKCAFEHLFVNERLGKMCFRVQQETISYSIGTRFYYRNTMVQLSVV